MKTQAYIAPVYSPTAQPLKAQRSGVLSQHVDPAAQSMLEALLKHDPFKQELNKLTTHLKKPHEPHVGFHFMEEDGTLVLRYGKVNQTMTFVGPPPPAGETGYSTGILRPNASAGMTDTSFVYLQSNPPQATTRKLFALRSYMAPQTLNLLEKLWACFLKLTNRWPKL